MKVTQNPPLATACRFDSGLRHQWLSAFLCIAAWVGLCSECAASEPVADRTCIWSDTALTCYDLFAADVVLDSSPQPLTSEAGPGFMRLGYVDSVTGRWVEVAATGYAWRTWTSYPQPRTILVWVDEYDLIGGGGFEGEYAHPLR